MSVGAVLVALMLQVLGGTGWDARVRALDAERAGPAAKKILENKGYQKELPGEGGDAVTGGAGSGADPRGKRVSRQREDDGSNTSSLAGGSVVGQGLLWIVMAVCLALLLVWLVSSLGGWQKNERAPDEKAADEPTPFDAAVVERPLGDAEALARAGRYGEAIHALLLRTLEELTRRLDRPLPRSFTSREILGRVALPPEARDALAHLVTAVEVTHFGGAEPGPDDYAMCVDRFQRFAVAYRAGTVATIATSAVAAAPTATASRPS